MADGLTQLVKIGARIDSRAVVWHLQGSMHTREALQAILNRAERQLGLTALATGRRQRQRADCKCKFIVDPVRQLSQQQSLRMNHRFGRSLYVTIHLATPDTHPEANAMNAPGYTHEPINGSTYPGNVRLSFERASRVLQLHAHDDTNARLSFEPSSLEAAPNRPSPSVRQREAPPECRRCEGRHWLPASLALCNLSGAMKNSCSLGI